MTMLLRQGNTKLGSIIHHFSLPAVKTCPGRTSVCESVCYARKFHFLLETSRKRHVWNLRQSRRKDFAYKMAKEIRQQGILLVRIHVAGDFYDANYAVKWLAVMSACPNTKFWLYTRSWRVPEIFPVLERMARLKNCRVWFSTDSETELPERVPPGVRLAFLQTEEEDITDGADLIFRTKKLRNRMLSLSLVCPYETPQGRLLDTNCANCGHCWK